MNENLTLKAFLRHAVLVVLILLDLIAAAWFLADSGGGRALAFGLHIALLVLALLAFRDLPQVRLGAGNNFLLIACSLALVLPFYGLLGMYVAMLVADRSNFQPIDYFAIEEEALPDRYKQLMHGLSRQAAGIKRDELDIEAFRDIFKTHDRQLEENAINKLAGILTRDSVSILKDVVRHATSDTKVLAATALIDMEDKVVERIEQTRARLDEQPDDSVTVLELARVYDLYCYLGVLDRAIRDYYRTLAIEQYRTFLVFRPKDPQATLEYGRSLLNAGELEQAISVLKEAVALDPGNPKPHFWLAEAYYESGDLQEVTSICKRINNYQNLPDNFRAVTGWWAEEDAWLLN